MAKATFKSVASAVGLITLGFVAGLAAGEADMKATMTREFAQRAEDQRRLEEMKNKKPAGAILRPLNPSEPQSEPVERL